MACRDVLLAQAPLLRIALAGLLTGEPSHRPTSTSRSQGSGVTGMSQPSLPSSAVRKQRFRSLAVDGVEARAAGEPHELGRELPSLLLSGGGQRCVAPAEEAPLGRDVGQGVPNQVDIEAGQPRRLGDLDLSQHLLERPAQHRGRLGRYRAGVQDTGGDPLGDGGFGPHLAQGPGLALVQAHHFPVGHGLVGQVDQLGFADAGRRRIVRAR